MLLQVETLTPFFSNNNWKQHVTSVLLMGSSNCEKNRNVKRKQFCKFFLLSKLENSF